MKNFVQSPQGGYHACEVLLWEVATTFPNKPLAEKGTQAGYRHKKVTAKAKNCSPGGTTNLSLGFTIVLAEVGFYTVLTEASLSSKLMTRRKELLERERALSSLPTMWSILTLEETVQVWQNAGSHWHNSPFMAASSSTICLASGWCLKVPKREIFDRSNFPDFYAIKSSWVCDLVVKILTYYFNFWGS